jgi:hypothetical protein
MLSQLIAARTADTLTLTTGITLDVRSASFRRLRGMTNVAVLADECAFWMSDESSNPDTEIIAAARPTVATTGGPIIAISSPHARKGLLWEMYRRHYGPDGAPDVLVAHGDSRTFNPSLSQSVVDRAMELDAAAASAEYGAQFRTDIEGFIAREVVEACIDNGVRERPQIRTNIYTAFCDPSGGSSESMTLAISHVEGNTTILDLVREVSPPFSPEATVAEFADIMAKYRISTVHSDKYGAEWVAEQFRKNRIHLQPSERSKSDLYRELLPMLNAGSVALLDNDRLLLQLTMLERRTARGGKDSIDHPRGAHDDLANAVAGALVSAYTNPGLASFRKPINYPKVGVV